MRLPFSFQSGVEPVSYTHLDVYKRQRGRFTLRFNEGDPIHEAAIGLLELQSPRTKAQYVANAVVYYNEHFRQEPQPLNASIISKEAVVAIVKEILRQEGMGPVSYTHLDVYKRQEHGTAISLSFHINCLIHEVQS